MKNHKNVEMIMKIYPNITLRLRSAKWELGIKADIVVVVGDALRRVPWQVMVR